MVVDNAERSEAERLLGISEKLLESRDLTGAREFAVAAQESSPLLDGTDQILAISDVLIAADKRINGKPNWYGVLQLDGRSDDLDLLKKQYRRLALLLHPDKSKFAYSHDAFRLVSDAWAVVSDPSKKLSYDKELHVHAPVNLSNQRTQRAQTRQFQSPNAAQKRSSNFWTACPYCYNLHQYPRVYVNCCLKCCTCDRAIDAVEVTDLPSIVPGKDLYNCSWGYFPMGYVSDNNKNGINQPGFPNWMPPLFESIGAQYGNVNATSVQNPGSEKRGRGRPRKFPFNQNMGHVSGSVEAEIGNVNVTPFYGNVNMTPVYGNVASTGTRKRGRPRKNQFFQNMGPGSGGVEAEFRNLNAAGVEKNWNVNVAPGSGSVTSLGTKRRGRPRKNQFFQNMGDVSGGVEAEFGNVSAAGVEKNWNVNVSPVGGNVTSVGTKRRGRPRKNQFFQNMGHASGGVEAQFGNGGAAEVEKNRYVKGNATPVSGNMTSPGTKKRGRPRKKQIFQNTGPQSGGVEVGFGNVGAVEVEKNQDVNVNVTPVSGNVTSTGTKRRGRPRKYPFFQNMGPVSSSVGEEFGNGNVVDLELNGNVVDLELNRNVNVNLTPVGGNVTSVQNTGAKKRGRPRKNL